MKQFIKIRWLLAITILFLIVLGNMRFPPHLKFADAQNRAEREFIKLASYDDLKPTDFGPVKIEDRGNSWLFEWSLLNGSGGYTVIVEQDGEIASGPDQKLYDWIKKNRQQQK